jgi:C_GCAxxG_C_C family probable redox protein
MTREEAINISQSYFDEGYACSQSVLLTFAKDYNLDEKTAKLISSTFGGGMGRLREKCGAVTGAFMILGLAYGNVLPDDMETKLYSYEKVREFNTLFEKNLGTTVCFELLKKYATESDVSERKHHKIICRKVIGEASGLLFDMLKT